MCLSIGSALGIAGSAFEYLSGVDQADTQNAYALANARSANQAAIGKYSDEIERFREEMANRTRERIAITKDTIAARGTAAASTQNQGISTDLVMRDLERQGAEETGLIDSVSLQARQQHLRTQEAIQAEAESRINAAPLRSGPSLLGAAVSGVGAWYGAKLNEGEPKRPYRHFKAPSASSRPSGHAYGRGLQQN